MVDVWANRSTGLTPGRLPRPYPGLVPLHYLAYGSNLAPGKVASFSSRPRYIGPARLPDHRLAFTRRSVRTGTGVADVLEAPGMTVWGALYELKSRGLDRIDEKEGRKIGAYDRIEVRVFTQDDEPVEAITYSVVQKESEEVKPSREYLAGLVDGAAQARLPEPYRRFLEALRDEWDDEPEHEFRRALLVRGTATRSEARGTGLVKVNPTIRTGHSLGRYAAVVYRGRAALAEVCETEACDERSCELDQSVRQALGIPGRESFGAHVALARVRGVPRRPWLRLIRPRTLVLPVWPPSWLDSEKQIVVLHEKNIAALGLVPGEVVRIWSVVSEGATYSLRHTSLRVFGGSAPTINRSGEQIDYPRADEVYMDRDGRNMLAIPERYPALVEPDVTRLFSSRLLLYGVTLFLGVAALADPLNTLAFGDTESVVVAFGVALIATILLVLYDIRGRVRY
jgi:gamma-glutamylcyclotransferase